MNAKIKAVLSAKFIAIMAAFFLPFITVSCGEGTTYRIDGVQMLTGDEIKVENSYTKEEWTAAIGSELYAVLAFAAALIGLIGSLGFKGRNVHIHAVAFGTAGILCLLLLNAKLHREVAKASAGIFRIQYEAGYWAALVLFAAAAVFGLYLLKTDRTRPAQAETAASGPPGEGGETPQ